MYKIKVVHCKKTSEKYEYIGRPSPLGNPFIYNKETMVKGSTLPAYEKWLKEKIKTKDKKVCDELNRLYKIAMKQPLFLGCWCSPTPCHGDIIKSILEEVKNKNNVD